MVTVDLADDQKTLADRSWRDGKIIIMATMAEGPDAGKQVVCITPRSKFRDSLPRISRNLRDRDFCDSVRAAIRDQVSRGMSKLQSSNDRDFMDDIAILMAMKLVAGENIVNGSGLFTVMILVNQDESLPWHKRGFVANPRERPEWADQK